MRQSFRLLSRHKRFTGLAMVSLGVAIALNTTMYSVLDAMIRPKLLMHQPDRLYEAPYFGDYRRRVPVREKNEMIVDHLTFHEGAAGYQASFGGTYIERGNTIRDARVLTITPNFFEVLGVRPSAGRLLSQADIGSPAIVLSERTWKRLFPELEHFQPSEVTLNGEPRTVVGLLPYEADYPGAYTDAWTVASAAALPTIALDLFRLKPEATLSQARAELEALNLRIMERSGDEPPHAGFRLRKWITPQFRAWGFHLALISAVVAVLLVACANLANLQLARGVARTREMATRVAVGASRGHIIRQLVIESTWLAVGGLLLGAILTLWGMKIIDASVPDTLAEYVTRPQMSWRVGIFAVLATFFCLITIGLLPALRLSRVDVNELLKSGAGTGQSRKARRQYAYLVVAEVALALALVSGATLLARAAWALHIDVPERFDRLASAWIWIEPTQNDVRTRRAWSEFLVDRVSRDTLIESAATVAYRSPSRRAISVDDPGGVPRVSQLPGLGWGYQVVSPDYLRTMALKILKGRDFSPGEFAEPQVIVDQHTAALLWPGTNPIGKLVKLDSPRVDVPWMKVAGVAEALPGRWELRDESLRTGDPRPALRNVWVLNAHDTTLVKPATGTALRGGTNVELVVRGRGDPRRIPSVLRNRLTASSPGIRFVRPQTFEERMGIRVMRERHDFIASLFSVFALCALSLAALGVYAIIAHSVAQRTREFGVRVAVGASAREIRQLVLREGSTLALLGIALGLLVTAWSAGLLRAFLFSEYDRYDSRVFAVTSLLLFAVAWLASFIPAHRATRINPVEALRND